MAAPRERTPADRAPEFFVLPRRGCLWRADDGEFRFFLGMLGGGDPHRWAQLTLRQCSKVLALLTAHFIADGESVAPFGSATGKHLASVFCCHSCAKPMLIAPLAIARLKSAFHGFKLLFIVRNKHKNYDIFFVKTSLCLAPFIVDLAPIFVHVFSAGSE